MTPAICRASRALLGMSQRQLGTKAGVSAQTIADFERRARTPHSNNLKAIRNAFEAQGIHFDIENSAIVAINLRHFRETEGTKESLDTN